VNVQEVPHDALALIHSRTRVLREGLAEVRKAPIDLDIESIQWVEGYLDKLRGKPELADRFAELVGCYLGDAIIAVSDGEWRFDDRGNLGVQFGNGIICFPFNKAAKLAKDGLVSGESLAGFYRLAERASTRSYPFAEPSESHV
jgi:hypothetical protein